MIMDGESLKSGAVAAVKNVKNPITLARMVMDHTPHCLLVGDGARVFANEMGIPVTPTEDLVTPEACAEYAHFQSNYGNAVATLFNDSHADPKEEATKAAMATTTRTDVLPLASTTPPSTTSTTTPISISLGHDTVGAVAYDSCGRLACATSTGGITGKRPGRVGDSPLIGAGGYADNAAGACSVTGHGESIMRTLLASRVVRNMDRSVGHDSNFTNEPTQAAREALLNMHARVSGRGGVVCIDSHGRIGHWATTEAMAWASASGEVGKKKSLF